ncbi:hypothetical protein [Amycolatopsis taiwanensis]|uniref:Chromosome segregation ATPase n=1 Tax=Amycolatopsis taiwanensis TaxID=342230 RepID=A0A9W6R305_9PSEU|nr:hypothetical protein [Amycolatopsis taiwanensis]GLY66642.1 hypothetical protein Atai01_32610 [Amycolatopsis taiwanensis]
MTDEVTEVFDEPVNEERAVPPPWRNGRDERREATLRAFSAGVDAYCAYCGHRLPPIPARGGRPSPYCAADPERYGRWGAKVITCAMLDECREIWVRTYGQNQPMTQFDVRVLDERAAGLLAALDPVREEIGALRTRLSEETAAALEAKAAAEQARATAEEQAREAEAERDRALADAEQARQQAERDLAERRAAQAEATQAGKDRDEAVARQKAAEGEKDRAVADRERALDQVTAAQERVAELQAVLVSERATAVERLDQLRREEDQARQDLRATLTQEYEGRLRARADEFDAQTRALRAAADERVAELGSQLTQATHTYAETLGPLHEQLSRLRQELAEKTADAMVLRRQLDGLRAELSQVLDQAAEGEPLRDLIAAALAKPETTANEPG